MMDSWSARNVDPGLAATYSKLRDLITSSMKSEPGRSVVYTSTRGGGGLVSAAASAALGSGVVARACAACAAFASATTGLPPRAATPAAAPIAAPFRKPRRLTEPFLDLDMMRNLLFPTRSASAIAHSVNHLEHST